MSEGPTQPGWGQPWGGTTPPPPPPQRRRRTTIIVLVVLGVGALLFAGCVGALIAASGGGDKARVANRAPTTTRAAGTTTDTETTETTDTSEPETTQDQGPPVARLGDTLELSNGLADTVAEITVGGLTSPSHHKGIRFSTGDEFNTPEHGLWMGVWVKVKALDDGIDTPDLHVNQGGHHYGSDACCPEGFKPELGYATLSKGETAEGWVLFDVAGRHGEIVLVNNTFDNKRLGAWRF